MLVKINGLPIIDEQEKLFQEVKESFMKFIDVYRKKHWFKEFLYQFTNGEDLIDFDRIRARLWYCKLVIVLKLLRVFLKISPPNRETLEQLLESVEQLRVKLEVD